MYVAEVSQFNEEYAASNEKFIERTLEVLNIRDIEQPLSRTNYKKKFHNLICWEEKAHIELLHTKYVYPQSNTIKVYIILLVHFTA